MIYRKMSVYVFHAINQNDIYGSTFLVHAQRYKIGVKD